MSLGRFNRRLRLIEIPDNDRNWFAKWLDGYTRHNRLDPERNILTG